MSQSVIRNNWAMLVGFAAGVPLTQMFVKSRRVAAGDAHVELCDAKFRSIFWRRGSEFTRSLNDLIHEDVLADPDRVAGTARDAATLNGAPAP